MGGGTSDGRAIQHAKSRTSLQHSLASGAHVQSITESESRLEIGTRREEYVLNVPDDGPLATLSANSTLGILRGLTTFEQLFYEWSGDLYTLEAPVDGCDHRLPRIREFLDQILPERILRSMYCSHCAVLCSTHLVIRE